MPGSEFVTPMYRRRVAALTAERVREALLREAELRGRAEKKLAELGYRWVCGEWVREGDRAG